MAHISGFNPLEPTWKFNVHRVLHLLVILVGVIMTVYSTICEWPVKIEIIKVFQGVGIFTQTILKGIFIARNGDSLRSLRADITEMYKTIEKVDDERKKLLKKCVKNCETIFKVLFFVDSSAVFIFLAYPVVALIFLDDRPLMLPFYVPIFDRETVVGFVINSICHGLTLLYTLVFHNSFDSIFALFVMQVVVKVELLKLELDEFQDYLLSSTHDPKDQMEIKKKLRDLILSSKSLDCYVDKLGKSFIMPCFVTVATSVFSICVALILLLIVNWILAYGLTWALFGQIFVYFVYGTIVYHEYQILNDHVWSFPWYLLSPADQMIVKLVLMKTQRVNLKMHFIGPLNMETFKNVSS